MRYLPNIMRLGSCSALALLFVSVGNASLPSGYQGTVFSDSVYKAGPQAVPGQVHLALYDRGGEGVAFHDADLINHGSGSDNKVQQCTDSACNPLPAYYCFFRGNEAVDITAPKCIFDFFARKGTIMPPSHENFVEFTVKGEWVNCTIDVKKKGTYRIGALYGIAAKDSAFISINNVPKAGRITYPAGTGGAHFWVYSDTLGTITFQDTGINLLTFNFAGGENINYLNFTLVGQVTSVSERPAYAETPSLMVKSGVNGSLRISYAWPGADKSGLGAFDVSGKETLILRDRHLQALTPAANRPLLINPSPAK